MVILEGGWIRGALLDPYGDFAKYRPCAFGAVLDTGSYPFCLHIQSADPTHSQTLIALLGLD